MDISQSYSLVKGNDMETSYVPYCKITRPKHALSHRRQVYVRFPSPESAKTGKRIPNRQKIASNQQFEDLGNLFQGKVSFT